MFVLKQKTQIQLKVTFSDTDIACNYQDSTVFLVLRPVSRNPFSFPPAYLRALYERVSKRLSSNVTTIVSRKGGEKNIISPILPHLRTTNN